MFFRFIDGQAYDGIVKEKEQAQQQYTEAVSRGESAGIVRYMDQMISLLLVVLMLYFGTFGIPFGNPQVSKILLAELQLNN